MSTTVFDPAWRPADVDEEATWAASGAAWLTVQSAGTPTRLVRETVGLTRYLDEHGAALADLVPAEGVGLLAERAALLRLPPAGRTSSGAASRLVPTRDGWLALTLARTEDTELIPAWLETEPVGGDQLDPWWLVERELMERSATKLVERAAMLGIPAALVGETTDAHAVQARAGGQAPPLTLDAATVVNLGSLWAAPLCGDLLARCGARLIKVESVHRPDGSRRRPVFFEALHGRSESVALDFSSNDRVHLIDLLRRADVVIESSRPRALAQLGIVAETAVLDGPRVWLSITGHGRAAPERVGFGDDTAAAGGLLACVDDEPRFIGDAIADPLTGLVAAATAAQLLGEGGRWFVDIAMSRVSRAMAGDWRRGSGRAAIEPPRPRRDPGKALPLGRDTERVLRSL